MPYHDIIYYFPVVIPAQYIDHLQAVLLKLRMIGIYFSMASASMFESSYNLELLKGIEKVLTYQNRNARPLRHIIDRSRHIQSFPSLIPESVFKSSRIILTHQIAVLCVGLGHCIFRCLP